MIEQDFSYNDATPDILIQHVATQLVENESLERAWGNFVLSRDPFLFTQSPESFSYISPNNIKVAFYHAKQGEREATQELEKEGVPVIRYTSEFVTFHGDTYVTFVVPTSTINLDYIAISPQAHRNSFGITQILQETGTMLGKIHRAGYLHGNFKKPNILDLKQETASLRLFGNADLIPLIDTPQGSEQEEITSFLESIGISSQHMHDTRIKVFMEAYQSLWK